MKKLLLLPAFLFFQNSFAQAPPCNTTPAPSTVIATPATVCTGGSSSLTLNVNYSGSSGLEFQWATATSSVGPYTSIAGATTTAYTTPPLNMATWYQVYMVCINGGTTAIATPAQVVVTTCTGIQQNGMAQTVRLYPVPANQALTVELPGVAETAFVRVLAMDGRVVAAGTQDVNNEALFLNLRTFDPGMYTLEISSQGRQARKLFLVEK